MKLKPEDLERIKEKMRASTMLREGTARVKVTVHMGTCGIASGSRAIMKAFMDELAAAKPSDVILTTSGCAGLCSHEPMATVELRGEAPVKYVKLTALKVKEIFTRHVLQGSVVGEYALGKGSERVG